MALPTASDNEFPKVILEEVANDGSATTTPAADHRSLFLGEDGALHLKDSAAAVTDIASASAHIADTSDAHDASAVSVLDTATNFTGADVEAVLAELQDNIDAVGAGATIAGPTPRAFPLSHDPSAAYATAVNIAANGGSIAIAMMVPGPMNLDSVRVRNTDASLARQWGWDLYEQQGATNTLTRVAASNGDESFTAGAASVRTLAAASAPVVLSAGVYWLVIQSTHATNSFGVGSTAPAALASAAAQTKTTTNPNGATLDFTAATWTKVIASYAVIMDGRVFGEATPY